MLRLPVPLLLCVLTAGAAAQTVVVPQQAASTEGNSSTPYPWNPNAVASGCARVQNVYSKNNFINQGVAFPIYINQLSWRANGGSFGGGAVFPGVEVIVSTAAAGAVNGLNPTFANNHGPDAVTVFPSGPLATVPVSGGFPNSYICTVTFATPFLYIPANGDLCVDVSNQNATGVPGVVSDMSVGIGGNGSRLWDTTPGSTVMTGATGASQPAAANVMQVGYFPVVGTIATNTTVGAGCIRRYSSFYEDITPPASFDLNGMAMTLYPIPGAGYLVTGTGGFLPVGTVSTPVSLTLTDDDQELVPLTVMGSFPAPTGAVTSLMVCSNGFVSTATGNGTSYTGTVGGLLNAAQTIWSGAWHDYNPAASGAVKVEESAGLTVITWDAVRSFGGASPADDSTFQFQFFPSGEVVIAWQSMAATTFGSGTGYFIGYSTGGPSFDPGETDLSAALPAGFTTQPQDLEVLKVAATSRPKTGTIWNLTTSNVPPNGVFGIDMIGLFNPNVPDLGFIGMPTCGLYNSLDLTSGFPVTGSTHTWSLPIPLNPSLANILLYCQSLVFEIPPYNAFGAITSNGVEGLVGIH